MEYFMFLQLKFSSNIKCILRVRDSSGLLRSLLCSAFIIKQCDPSLWDSYNKYIILSVRIFCLCFVIAATIILVVLWVSAINLSSPSRFNQRFVNSWCCWWASHHGYKDWQSLNQIILLWCETVVYKCYNCKVRLKITQLL